MDEHRIHNTPSQRSFKSQQRKSRKRTPLSRGFTLIELVVVIVITAILAAIAVPVYLNMARDARIAAVNAGAGAVTEAANNAFLKCNLTPSCNTESSFPPMGSVMSPDGLSGALYNGYPLAQAVYTFSSISSWAQLDGFTAVENPSYTFFQLNGAPDPTNCRIVYVDPQVLGLPPAVTAVTSGC